MQKTIPLVQLVLEKSDEGLVCRFAQESRQLSLKVSVIVAARVSVQQVEMKTQEKNKIKYSSQVVARARRAAGGMFTVLEANPLR